MDGSTALMYACRAGLLEVVKYLVYVAKADVHRRDAEGKDALAHAFEKHSCDFYAHGIVNFLSLEMCSR